MILEFDRTKLRQLRKDKKLTQKEVGEAVGKTEQHISNYENNHSLPSPNTLLSLLNFFNVSAKDVSRVVRQ